MLPRTVQLATSVLVPMLAAALQAAPETLRHEGMSGASAAVFVAPGLVVVANDEDNVLRTYRADAGGPPVARFDAGPWLHVGGRNQEADIEGAARMGDRIYWIGSHGRGKEGKARPNRRRLFATDIVPDPSGTPHLHFAGVPCMDLLDQMSRVPELAALGLGPSSAAAPEANGGTDIEALAAGPGESLLIGLRSPVPEGRAVIVPLANPGQIVAGRPARFDKPIRLDLDGRGLRDMAWTGRDWYLIAGSGGGRATKPRLYRWSGPGHTPVRVGGTGLKHFNPEAVAVPPPGDKDGLLVCSDDGKEARGAAVPSFRSFRVRTGDE